MTLENDHTSPSCAPAQSGEVDFTDYLNHLGDLDLSLDQKLHLLKAIAVMMEAFVLDAFGDDPTTHALAARNEKGAILRSVMIESNLETPTQKFARAQRREE